MAMYKIKTTNIENFTGIDAGGVAFANGEEKISDARMAAWFREHDGYAVERIDEVVEKEEEPKEEKPKKAKAGTAGE